MGLFQVCGKHALKIDGIGEGVRVVGVLCGLCPWQKDLKDKVGEVRWSEQSRAWIDLHKLDVIGDGEGFDRERLSVFVDVELFHKVDEDRQSGVARVTTDGESCLVVVSDPDACADIWCITDKPRIADLVGRPCFSGDRTFEDARTPRSPLAHDIL